MGCRAIHYKIKSIFNEFVNPHCNSLTFPVNSNYSTQSGFKGAIHLRVCFVWNPHLQDATCWFFCLTHWLRMIFSTELQLSIQYLLDHTQTRHLIISGRGAPAPHTAPVLGEESSTKPSTRFSHTAQGEKSKLDFQSKAYLNGSLMRLKFHWGPTSGAAWIQEKMKNFIDQMRIVISPWDEICASDIWKSHDLRDKLLCDPSNLYEQCPSESQERYSLESEQSDTEIHILECTQCIGRTSVTCFIIKLCSVPTVCRRPLLERKDDSPHVHLTIYQKSYD